MVVKFGDLDQVTRRAGGLGGMAWLGWLRAGKRMGGRVEGAKEGFVNNLAARGFSADITFNSVPSVTTSPSMAHCYSSCFLLFPAVFCWFLLLPNAPLCSLLLPLLPVSTFSLTNDSLLLLFHDLLFLLFLSISIWSPLFVIALCCVVLVQLPLSELS